MKEINRLIKQGRVIVFGRQQKTDNDISQKNDNKKSDALRVKDDNDKRRKRKTILERFRDSGYDSGFVYHEE